MKIVFLTSSLDSGGAERVATTLSNAWVARGDSVTLIATFSGGGGGQPFYKMSDLVEVLYLADFVGVKPKNIFSYAQRLWALRKLIVERKPDVIVSFLPNVNVAAITSSAFLQTPLIICERSDPSIYPYSRIGMLLCKLTYRFADMLAVQTESVAAKVREIYPGLRQVSCIPNPLPQTIEQMKARPANQRKVLLSLGRLSSEKQIDKLLNAFANAAVIFPDWDLHIYGDGPEKSALDAQIRKSGLAGRAILKGATLSPWKVMAASDAFVMVSAFEGFPNALLEAMGIGLPCIAFDCPSGPREISGDGRDALLVPLNDQAGLVAAMTKIMGDDELRKSLGKKARAAVLAKYSLHRVIDQWDELFKDVRVLHLSGTAAFHGVDGGC